MKDDLGQVICLAFHWGKKRGTFNLVNFLIDLEIKCILGAYHGRKDCFGWNISY